METLTINLFNRTLEVEVKVDRDAGDYNTPSYTNFEILTVTDADNGRDLLPVLNRVNRIADLGDLISEEL